MHSYFQRLSLRVNRFLDTFAHVRLEGPHYLCHDTRIMSIVGGEPIVPNNLSLRLSPPTIFLILRFCRSYVLRSCRVPWRSNRAINVRRWHLHTTFKFSRSWIFPSKWAIKTITHSSLSFNYKTLRMLANLACFCHRVNDSIVALLALPLTWAKMSTILGWVTCKDKRRSNRVAPKILSLFHLQISNFLQRLRYRKFTLLRVNRSPFHLIWPTCLYSNFVAFTIT